MNSYSNCPSCGEKLKSGVFSSNDLLSEDRLNIISEFLEIQRSPLCTKCGSSKFETALNKLKTAKAQAQKQLRKYLEDIPIITTPMPFGWEYKILGIVTAQSTTGTGVLSEFKSGWTDFFGVQSSSFNKKIAAGEQFCMEQLRAKTSIIGGNAIIAADIDYSEMGAEKGMIMVCMAGTAVRLNNPQILGSEKAEIINQIDLLIDKMRGWAGRYPALYQGL